MTEQNMDAFAAPGKRKRGRPTADSYSWHQCFHDKALAGVADLSPEQRGVYVTIMWLCYSRRGPLPDDDRWLARQCNCSARLYRRVKAELITLARIAVDEENGHLYDERTMRELVKAEVFSQAQADRASRPRKGQKPRVVVDNDAARAEKLSVSAQFQPVFEPESDAKVESSDDGNSMISNTSNIKKSSQREKKREDIYPNRDLPPAAPRRLPLESGGAAVGANPEKPKPIDRNAWLEEQRRKLGLAFDEPANKSGPPAGRRRRRTAS